MKKNQIIKILISLATVLIFIGLFYLVKDFNQKNNQTLISKNFAVLNSKVEVVNLENKNNTNEVKTESKKDNLSKDVSLIVSGKTYSTFLKDGESVYDVMNRLKTEGFTFKGVDNPGLGFFVESINGIKQGNGKYWFFYVNNTEAQVGVSNYILQKGDIINWELK